MTLKRFNQSVSALWIAQEKFIFGCQNLELLHILLSFSPHLLKLSRFVSRCVQHRQPRVILIMKCHFDFLCIR
jgi:hypothetical protein